MDNMERKMGRRLDNMERILQRLDVDNIERKMDNMERILQRLDVRHVQATAPQEDNVRIHYSTIAFIHLIFSNGRRARIPFTDISSRQCMI
jgi:hypothetical protein